MNLKSVIYKKIEFNPQRKNGEEFIHLAFGVDKYFIPPLGIFLTSIALQNREQCIYCHIFYNSIEEDDLKKIKKFVSCYPNITICLYYIDDKVFQCLDVTRGYTLAIYNRIIIAEILYPQVKAVLYLDSDMLCVGKINAIENVDISEYIFSAVLDKNDSLDFHKKEIGLKQSDNYFNSGVLYINLKNWQKYNLLQKMIDLLSKKNFAYPDQDALNLLAGKLAGQLPEKYNEFYLMNTKGIIPNDTIFIHFAGAQKPWHKWCTHEMQVEMFEYYKQQSLWNNWQYHPFRYWEFRKLAKYYRKQGEYYKGMKNYFIYSIRRISEKLKK